MELMLATGDVVTRAETARAHGRTATALFAEARSLEAIRQQRIAGDLAPLQVSAQAAAELVQG